MKSFDSKGNKIQDLSGNQNFEKGVQPSVQFHSPVQGGDTERKSISSRRSLPLFPTAPPNISAAQQFWLLFGRLLSGENYSYFFQEKKKKILYVSRDKLVAWLGSEEDHALCNFQQSKSYFTSSDDAQSILNTLSSIPFFPPLLFFTRGKCSGGHQGYAGKMWRGSFPLSLPTSSRVITQNEIKSGKALASSVPLEDSRALWSRTVAAMWNSHRQRIKRELRDGILSTQVAGSTQFGHLLLTPSWNSPKLWKNLPSSRRFYLS